MKGQAISIAEHNKAKSLLSFMVNPNGQVKNVQQPRKATTSTGGSGPSHFYSRRQLIGLIFGPLLFMITLLFFQPADLPKEALAVLASTIWIATWWITEAIPIPATSLLPIILFPLTGQSTVKRQLRHTVTILSFYSWEDSSLLLPLKGGICINELHLSLFLQLVRVQSELSLDLWLRLDFYRCRFQILQRR